MYFFISPLRFEGISSSCLPAYRKQAYITVSWQGFENENIQQDLAQS
jgi:hypothetical protein